MLCSRENVEKVRMLSLQQKAQKVFRGLDEKDYKILETLRQLEPASPYDVLKQVKKQIWTATFYRRFNNLCEKGFIKEIKTREEKTTYQITEIKGALALFGAGLKLDPSIDMLPQTLKSVDFEDFAEKLFDYLISAGEDLTDKPMNLESFVYRIAVPFVFSRPNYFLQNFKINSLATKDFLRMQSQLVRMIKKNKTHSFYVFQKESSEHT